MGNDNTIRLNISTEDRKNLADNARKKVMTKSSESKSVGAIEKIKDLEKIKGYKSNRSGFLTSEEEKRRDKALQKAILKREEEDIKLDTNKTPEKQTKELTEILDANKEGDLTDNKKILEIPNADAEAHKKKKDLYTEIKKKTSSKNKKNQDKSEFDEEKIRVKEFKKKKAKLENIEVDINTVYGDYLSDKSSPNISRKRSKKKQKSHLTIQKNKIVNVYDGMSIKDLALGMAIKSIHLVNFFNNLGIKAKQDSEVSIDDAVAVIEEMGQIAKRIDKKNYDYLFCSDAFGNSEKRSPVVVVMGHIDHGKTTLLDSLRNSTIATGEHGGVTQHIGAYKVTSQFGNMTIIDTPGHEAFSIMRERGVNATDIVILVVAADDGVKPQTVEAIKLIKNNNMPLVVAINKIDKEGVTIQKTVNELLNHGIMPESLGGDVVCIPISAKQKQNLEELIEAVILEADMLSLEHYPDARCSGYVIESHFNKFKSNYATVLVQNGSLNIGDFVVTKTCYCKVKSIVDDRGNKIKTAHASDPIEITGFNGSPKAGEKFSVVKDESLAKDIIQYYKKHSAKEEEAKKLYLDLDDNFGQEENPKINIIIKADTDGTAHSILKTINNIVSDCVDINVIKSDVGNISHADITLAEVSNAIIITFNSQNPPASVNALIKQKGIELFSTKIIYQIIDFLEDRVKSIAKKKIEKIQTGSGVVKQVFSLSKIGQIVGCRIEEGVVKKDYMLEFYDKETSELIGSAKTLTIKHYAEECEQTTVGMDFGLNIGKALNIYPGCTMKSFIVKE